MPNDEHRKRENEPQFWVNRPARSGMRSVAEINQQLDDGVRP